MKILVIDDEPRNIASALETLKGHEVTTASTIAEAAKLLEGFGALKFDVVLTDLIMPCNYQTQGNVLQAYTAKKPVPTELPIGLLFALTTSSLGVKTVICTDSNRHEDYFCTLLQMLPLAQGCFDDEASKEIRKNLKVVFVDARSVPMQAQWHADTKNFSPTTEWVFDQPLIKDWSKVLVKTGIVAN